MNGFFHSSKLIRTTSDIPRLAQCGSCGLHKGCQNPKMEPSGEGRKKILLVGDFPRKKDDIKGEQFTGKSGKLLKNMLSQVGVNMNRDCWKTNSLICSPVKSKDISEEKIKACSCNLFKTIKKLSPNVVILLGESATQSMVGTLLKENVSSMLRWSGWVIPNHSPNVWLCPTYHPSYLLSKNNSVLEITVLNHLRNAVNKAKSKPWEVMPDFKKEVEVVLRPSTAAQIIREQLKTAKVIAFDYETNCLKPEYPKSEIVSCSVCFDGKRTIAFPFSGKAIDAMIELLKSPIKKIASNLKFEDRWTKNKLKIKIKNWYWDTMLASHVLDNRAGITGLKFQSYVLLGQTYYDTHIKPFLESGDKGHLNRINEIGMEDLLIYNGLDSYLEYKIGALQRERVQNGRD